MTMEKERIKAVSRVFSSLIQASTNAQTIRIILVALFTTQLITILLIVGLWLEVSNG